MVGPWLAGRGPHPRPSMGARRDPIPVSFPGMRVVLNIRSICQEHMGTRPSAITWGGGQARLRCRPLSWSRPHPQHNSQA